MLRRDDTSAPEDNKGRFGIEYHEIKRAGFEEGRAFRTFYEFSLAGSATYTIRVIVPVETILFGLEVALDAGSFKLETIAGGTPGGTFAAALPIFPQNNMPSRPFPYVTPQNTLVGGGSISGGTLIDVIRLKSDANTNRAASVGSTGGDERGVAPGTYYFRLTNLESTPTITGTIKVRWEERT